MGEEVLRARVTVARAAGGWGGECARQPSASDALEVDLPIHLAQKVGYKGVV